MSDISREKRFRQEKFKHYTIGVPCLDEQHWELIEIISKIKRAIKRGCKRLVKKFVDMFFFKLEEHIKFENELMERIQFPYIKFHQSQEIENLNKLRKNIYSLETILLTNADDLDTVLKVHIDHQDRQITEFYNKWLESVTN